MPIDVCTLLCRVHAEFGVLSSISCALVRLSRVGESVSLDVMYLDTRVGVRKSCSLYIMCAECESSIY